MGCHLIFNSTGGFLTKNVAICNLKLARALYCWLERTYSLQHHEIIIIMDKRRLFIFICKTAAKYR